VNTQGRHITAKAALAAMTGLVLAGCSTSAGTSAGTSTSAPATVGSAATSGANSSVTSGPTASSAPGVVPAAALQFPVAVGYSWVYSSAVPSGTTSTITDKVLSVTPVASGHKVAESYANTLSSTTVRNSYVFHSDGSITLPLNQMSGGTLSSPTGGLVLPPAAVIASGQPYRYVLTIGFKEAGQKETETAHVTIQGAGTAMVTVPAGTYRATIINMTMAWTVATYTVDIEIKDWFANGTGTVKSEALIHEAGLNELVSTEVLESFTKG
jgi:uncharacterized protein DUF3108